MGKFADELLPKFADDPAPTLADFRERTFAWLIQRVIDDVAASPLTIRQFGDSALFTLKRLQREEIGKVVVAEMTKHHVIGHCKERRNGSASRKAVTAATTKGDITALRGVILHALSAFPDCEELNLTAFDKAKPYLVKNQLIGKAQARKRRPTDEEFGALVADLAISDAQPNTTIKMVPVVLFARASGRRRGEIVRIKHGGVDYEKKTYVVCDVKHPTKKKGNDKTFVLWPELEQIIKAQPRVDPNDPDERIFPYNGESVGKRYIDAKKRLGIKNLRFHDCRRDCISKYLLIYPPEDVRLMVSGHDNTKILEKNYDGRDTIEIMREKYPHLIPAQSGTA